MISACALRICTRCTTVYIREWDRTIRFLLTMVISSSDSFAYCFTYASAPPYFVCNSSKNAVIVPGLLSRSSSEYYQSFVGAYRHVNMLRAASLFDAKRGSFVRRAMML